MHRLVFSLAIALLAACPPSARAAERAAHDFEVQLRGLTVGSVRLALSRDGARYAARARIASAGLLQALRPFAYAGTSRGAVRKDGRLAPERFEEVADTGRRRSEAELTYARGVPRVLRYSASNPAAPDRPDPASQDDAVDPVTALAELLRDRPADRACGVAIVIYDGMRRSRVVLSAPRAEGDGLRCAGEYRRLQGFTDKELARNVAFPLEVTLAPTKDGLMRVDRIGLESSYGHVTLVRP